MIWQLMQRDLAWRRMRWFTLAIVAFCALWHFLTPADKFAGNAVVPLFVALVLSLSGGILASLNQGADTRFLAILPVTARQVFLSRILASMALMWLPFSAGMAVLLALKDPIVALSSLPLEFWTPFTCTALAIQCVVIRRGRVPGWLIVIALPVWVVVFTFASVVREVGGILALIVAASVLSTWRALPKSFQETLRR